MFGVGGSEIVIIIVIALLLFGTPVLTFMLGFFMGQRRSAPLAPGPDVVRPNPETLGRDEEPADE